MEKYGFVYIWYDRKHKRYYVGCHWGHENDRYICSSTWMRNAYKTRPKDFKRRILQRVHTSKIDMFIAEQQWLNLIKPKECKIRYYNISLNNRNYIDSLTEDNRKSVRKKISESVRRSLLEPEVQERKKLGYQRRDTKSADPAVRSKRQLTMLSGGKNKGKITAKDSAGNIFHTTKDDPRWLSGEIWAASKGIKRPPISQERKERIREAGNFRALNRKKVSCIHCGAVGNVGNISRYHNDRCKHKPVN